MILLSNPLHPVTLLTGSLPEPLGTDIHYIRDQRVAVELIINQLRVFLVFRSPVRAPSTVDEAHTEILVRWN